MSYASVKALHIIFVVTWFAALFYIFRLLVYHIESAQKEEPAKTILGDQLSIMERRLWNIIGHPSALLTLIFGVSLVLLNPTLLSQLWFQIKLVFLAILYSYHIWTTRIIRSFSRGKISFTSTQMRMINEGPTIILISVVFLAVVKNSTHWLYGLFGILGLAIGLTIAVKLYKRKREKNKIS